MANFNCAFRIVDGIEAFTDMFHILMVGSGAGFRVLKTDVEQLPTFRNNVKIIHEEYKPIPKSRRSDFTNTTHLTGGVMTITVGDSKFGWEQALKIYLDVLTNKAYKDIEMIIFNYDHVRPFGEKLKVFGGTASGHTNLEKMLNKISEEVGLAKTNSDSMYVKLEPYQCINIANIIAENVVSGGVRRSAQIALIDQDDEMSMQLKSKLYKVVGHDESTGYDIFEKDMSIAHREMSNNSIFYTEKPTRAKLNWHIETQKFTGEPAMINAEAASKRRPNYQGTNPCGRGDMRLLTMNGYKRFDELVGTHFAIPSADGRYISNSTVWSNGIKDTVNINLGNHKTLGFTADHVFMTVDGEECMAKDLVGKRLQPFIGNPNPDMGEFVSMGFMQGDGVLTDMNRGQSGVGVCIGEKDKDITKLFDINYQPDKKMYTITKYDERLRELGFDATVLPQRQFPSTFYRWTIDERMGFLKGCYSANGCVISGHRVAYKTTSYAFATTLLNELFRVGINAYVTCNKEHDTTFSNGTYTCKESYDINISTLDGIVKFYQYIGFVHTYKMDALRSLIKTKAPKVISVTPGPREEVYDFIEPKTHWGIVEGVVVHNCAEILLQNRGMCNLTEVNVHAFVRDDNTLDIKSLLRAQELSARAGYRMTFIELELPKWNTVQKEDRLLGCSITGWQDMVNRVGLDMAGKKAVLNQMRDTAVNAGNKYADAMACDRPLLTTTVKPSGTISLLPTVSSGVHFSHSPFYLRRIRVGVNDPILKVCEELGYSIKDESGKDLTRKVVEFPCKAPDGRTKYDVGAIEQLEEYKLFQMEYTQHNTSITVHAKLNEWDDIEQWIWDNWEYFVGVSFLGIGDDPEAAEGGDNMYSVLPYESCSEEKYNEVLARTPNFKPSLVNKYEVEDNEKELESDCTGGMCPIR